MKNFFLLFAIASASTASAATYNFYFNNTEQGNNSTAKPVVNVNAPVTKSDEAITVPMADPAPVSPPVRAQAPTPSTRAETAVSASERRESPRLFRITGGASFVDYQNSAYWGSYSKGRGAGLISAAVFPIPSFGVSLFFGGLSAAFNEERQMFGGLEVEYVPLRTRIVDLGVLVGMSNYKALTFENEPLTLHGGARITFNIVQSFGITTAVRYSPGNDWRVAMGEAGLQFRL